MEAIGQFWDAPHSALRQVPSTTPEENTLGQRDADFVDLDLDFQEYTSDRFEIAASPSALFPRPLHDESTDPHAERGYINISTQGLNEGLCVRPNKRSFLTNTPFFNTAIPDPPFGDYCRTLGHEFDSHYVESGHHYSCECSSCTTVYRDVSLSETHSFEPPVASTSQYSGELRALKVFDRSLPETELRGASDPPFQTVYLPMVQQLSNSTDILRLLKRCVGGKAICLWMHEGGECGFFSQIDLVKRHIKRVHLRLRPCACQCGRRFFNNYALSLHYNTHTGKKPFICNFCGKGFSTPSGKSHHRVRVHKYRVPRHSTLAADSLPEAEYSSSQEEPVLPYGM